MSDSGAWYIKMREIKHGSKRKIQKATTFDSDIRSRPIIFRASRYTIHLNRTSENKVMAFEFLERFRCYISSVSIYYASESDIWVKSCGRLNLPCSLMFNFKHVDILCAWIKHLSEKLWPYEFAESFRCSISRLSKLNNESSRQTHMAITFHSDVWFRRII